MGGRPCEKREPEGCESGQEALELGRERFRFELDEELKDAGYELNEAKAEWELTEKSRIGK